MDWEWLRVYGTFIAACIAAIGTVLNGVLQHRRDTRARDLDWLRNTRLPIYAEFVESAIAFRNGIFGQLGEWESDLGPRPSHWPDFHDTGDRFRLALARVELIGPPEVAARAKEVQFALWRYESQLENDPFHYDQSLSNEMLRSFSDASRAALAISSPDDVPSDYRAWLKRHGADGR